VQVRASLLAALAFGAVLFACSSPRPASVSAIVLEPEADASLPTFVLVHGWSNDARVWTEVAPLLAECARVIVLDLPGHGASPQAEDGDYSMDATARAIEEAMDEHEVALAILVGHGSGTFAVRQFFRLYPERVLGLVIVDGSLRAFSGFAEYAEGMALQLEGPERGAAVEEMFEGFPLGTMSEPHRALIHEMLQATPGPVQAATLRATLQDGLFAEDQIRVPVLLVMANSPFWDDDYRAFVNSLCPDLESEWWTGVSHWLMMQKPRRFADAVLGWADLRFAAF
jgi:pimeloyl-ACP methyl ester carboxylesterase